MNNITIKDLSLTYDMTQKKLDFIIPNNIKNAKIVDATLEIQKTLPVGTSNFQVKFLSALENQLDNNPWIIDELTNIEDNKNVVINISDEIQYCVNNSINNFTMSFINTSDDIKFNLKGNLKIDFIPNSEFQGNGNKNQIELGKAGIATINLVSGDMNISTPLVSSNNKTLPFSINANYNTKPNDLIKNIGMPKNWTLNFHQFLIRNDDKSSEEKKLISSKMVTGPSFPGTEDFIFDQNFDPNMGIFIGNGIPIVKNDQTENGKILSFTYIDKYGKNHIIEESYYVNNERKDRKDICVDLDGSLVYIDETKSKEDKEYKQKVTTKLTSPDGIRLISSIEGLKGSSLVDYKPEELSKLEKSISKLKDTITSTKVSISLARKQYCFNALELFNSENTNKYEIKSFNAFRNVILRNSIINNAYTITTDNENEEYDVLPDKFLQDFYENNKDSDEKISNFEFGNKLKKDQLQSLYENLYNLIKNLKEYNDQLKKYEYQKEQLELQVPVYYLYDEDNIIYGFGKTSKENIFRLILITDPYENNLFISYPSLEDKKIESISDADNNYATFTYNENNLLESIQDMQDRITRLNYSNFQGTNNLKNNNDDNSNFENFKLESIKFTDNTSSYFYYDEDGKIINVLNENGLGTTFTYNKVCVKKVESFSVLNGVSNGKITYNSSDGKFTSNIEDYNRQMIEDDKIEIDYNNYKSTTITNSKGKSVTYLFDKYGNATATYENNFKENNENCIAATFYNYSNNLISEKISKLVYSKNFLNDVSFSENSLKVNNTCYLGTTICSEQTLMSQTIEKENLFCLPNENNQEKSISVNVSNNMIVELNKDYSNETDIFKKLCNHKTFIVSGWAKADSAFIITDESENFPSYITSRKFELRVNVKYKNIPEDKQPSPFIKSFDWRNTNWQYCAVPIKFEQNQEIESITCYLDYSNNIGTIQFTNLELCEGDFEHIDFYDNNNKPRIKYSGHSKWQTEYEYDNNDNLIKEKISVRNSTNSPTYINAYEYNKNGKLFKTINYKGIVTENIFNDKGRIIKTLTYHKDEPASIFYEEHSLDNKGNENNSINEFGETTESYEYINNTNIVETSTDYNGNKTSFGYNNCGTLLQKTTTVDGIENANTYGYMLDFLTSLKHNNFEISYSYDNLGRNTGINIAGENYLTKTFNENEEIITLSNNERYKKVLNDNGKLQQLYFKSKIDTTDFTENDLIINNIYDTHNNLVSINDLNAHKTHKYFINKFGKTYKEEVSFSNEETATAPFILENCYDEEHDKVKTTKICVNNKTLNYEYFYSNSPDKILNSITLPNNFKQNLSYDNLERLTKIDTSIYSKQFSYLKLGSRTSNLVSSLSFSANNIINDKLYYKYDRNGNITEIRNHINLLIARYSYDSLHRLIREDNYQLGKTFTYSYDAGGNILSKLEFKFTLTNNLEYEEIIKENKYAYPSVGWKDKLLKFNEELFEYDNNLGNPNIYRGKNLLWSHGRQLDKFDNIEFHYDGNGLRLSKITNELSTKYYLNGNKIIAQDIVSKDNTKSTTLYFHYGADNITSFEYNNINYIYKKNLQNDIIGIYDTNRQEIAKYAYDAWGNQNIQVLDNGIYVDISKVSSDNDYRKIAELNPFRYRSYYYDCDTNLYYLNSRYYDPELGRFINADDISVLDTYGVINGLNTFSYCNNNPIMLTDNNGASWLRDKWNQLKNAVHQVWDVIVGTVISVATVVVGVALTVATFGACLPAGAALIGAGVGSLIGGLQSKIGGGSYWAGYFGGAISGGLTGLGISFGPVGAFIGGFAGNFLGSLFTDAINGKTLNINYFLNSFANSLLAGLVSIGSFKFGEVSKFFKTIGLKDLFIGLTVSSEFISNMAFNFAKELIRDFVNTLNGTSGISIGKRSGFII